MFRMLIQSMEMQSASGYSYTLVSLLTSSAIGPSAQSHAQAARLDPPLNSIPGSFLPFFRQTRKSASSNIYRSQQRCRQKKVVGLYRGRRRRRNAMRYERSKRAKSAKETFPSPTLSLSRTIKQSKRQQQQQQQQKRKRKGSRKSAKLAISSKIPPLTLNSSLLTTTATTTPPSYDRCSSRTAQKEAAMQEEAISKERNNSSDE